MNSTHKGEAKGEVETGDSNSGFFFPDEFPYDDFAASDLSSPLSSVDSDDDDAKLLPDLGCSPQSTLCSNRDWEEPRRPALDPHRHFHTPPQLHQLKQQQQQILRERTAVFFRRESAGTGVFLPRASVAPPPETSQSQSRKKPSCSTVVLPARVVQDLNLNLEEIGARPVFPGGGAFILDKEAMKARRMLQSQQRATQHDIPSSAGSESDAHLPAEWTY